MSYKISICGPAKRSFRNLEKSERTATRELVRPLKDEPRPFGSEPVVGYKGLLRVKCGDIRVIYAVFDKIKYVFILEVRKRNEATYKNLPIQALTSAITQTIARLKVSPPEC